VVRKGPVDACKTAICEIIRVFDRVELSGCVLKVPVYTCRMPSLADRGADEGRKAGTVTVLIGDVVQKRNGRDIGLERNRADMVTRIEIEPEPVAGFKFSPDRNAAPPITKNATGARNKIFSVDHPELVRAGRRKIVKFRSGTRQLEPNIITAGRFACPCGLP